MLGSIGNVWPKDGTTEQQKCQVCSLISYLTDSFLRGLTGNEHPEAIPESREDLLIALNFD